MQDDLFSPSGADALNRVDFTPSRAAGLARLKTFTPRMGRAYTSERNHDRGPDARGHVSALSPWVAHRQLLEAELVTAALERFAFSTAEKFIQEVCWRTYFKGWMEHRPSVWAQYQSGLLADRDRLDQDPERLADHQAAIEGRTGLDGFDAWARELVETGYLHNHARMWFASMWIYTLGLPWRLGADFFLRHLMDADAASNTCSWRWVGGLHTAGKTYLARRANVEKYTDGRFSPAGLAPDAPPLDDPIPGPRAIPLADAPAAGEVALLLTDEDLHGESLASSQTSVKAVAGVSFAGDRSPDGAGVRARAFSSGALDDALQRVSAHYDAPSATLPQDDTFLEAALDWARAQDVSVVMTGDTPVGWVRPRMDALEQALTAHNVRLVRVRRAWDAQFWPHAARGFFKLKTKIPQTLRDLGLGVG